MMMSNTNYKLKFKLVEDAPKDKLLLSKTVTEHLNASKGETLLNLTPQETSVPVGIYKTDMEITFSDGSRYTFYPPHVGKTACFHVTTQVTREDAGV